MDDRANWNVLRVGEVVGADPGRAAVKVHFEELDLTSDWMPVLVQGAHGLCSFWLPSVGDMVVCGFYSDGSEEGVVLGSYYQFSSPPADGGAGVYYTKFPDGSSVKWDNGALEIVALGGVTITGDCSITGDLEVTGSIHAGVMISAPVITEE